MRYILIILVFAAVSTSCTINNSVLLKAPKDHVFEQLPDTLAPNYKLSANDAIRFRLFANDGFQLIESANGSAGNGQSSQLFNAVGSINYQIEHDGFCKLPILGRVQLSGLTLREAELMLEKQYSTYYNSPFVMLSVANRRVVVFPGNAGAARVITLTENNTTILEAIAMAGGVTERGKAKAIRLIRTIDGERHVYNIDLSTIEGVEKIDLIVEANDVIYVEPVPDVASEILKDIAPIISLISSAFFIWIALTRGV